MSDAYKIKHRLYRIQRFRRTITLVLLGAMALIVVAACGGSPQTTSSETADVETASATRTIQHVLGEAEIPITPERLILLVPGAPLDNLLALGVQPIGIGIFANREYEVPPYLTEQIAEIESVGNFVQPNLEKIVQLQPDLIVIADFQKSIYPQLSSIAPTVALRLEAQTWQEDFLAMAELVNRTDVAQQLLNHYEQRADDFRAAMNNQSQNPEVSVVRVRTDGIFLYVKSSLIGQILEELDIQRPPAQDVFLEDSPRLSLSLEELEKADGDVMFVYGLEFRGTKARFAQLQTNPLWQGLDAVKNDQVYVVPDSYWSFPGIQGLNLLLDDLFKYLVNEPF